MSCFYCLYALRFFKGCIKHQLYINPDGILLYSYDIFHGYEISHSRNEVPISPLARERGDPGRSLQLSPAYPLLRPSVSAALCGSSYKLDGEK